MTKAHYEAILLALLSPLHNARPRDIDLQLGLSQVLELGDETSYYFRRVVSKNQIQVSMRIDIWKQLQSNKNGSNENGSSTDQSQSLELPTVLTVKDGNIYQRLQGNEKGSGADQSQSLELPTVLIVKNGDIYLRNIDSEIGDKQQGTDDESEIIDEERSSNMKSKAEQNGISLELRKEDPPRDIKVEIIDDEA
ncbi:hypothetical protein BDQ12DRAFT_670360 [Crucibulum laeve]|uniref:Uncharacterized protein n=1 Tax=Crucibulum laeve TaxID=68775 RepID=A0A5C3LKS1_9AGAR|nr:hypothetical protein BDQ12DRAFT_670360 [Crucibulum laeve]